MGRGIDGVDVHPPQTANRRLRAQQRSDLYAVAAATAGCEGVVEPAADFMKAVGGRGNKVGQRIVERLEIEVGARSDFD